MDDLKVLGMDYFTGVDMAIQSFHQYLHFYHYIFPSCYLLQVYMCSNHPYGSVWLSLFQFNEYLKLQPGAITAASGLFQLRNLRQDGDSTLFRIGWFAAVCAGLDTVHPNWMDIYFHCLTVHQFGAGG